MNFSKSPHLIQKMFDTIAERYDFNNNLISLGLHKKVKELAVKKLKLNKNSKILDLCTGTGDIALYLKKEFPSSDITAIDFSQEMISIAKNKSKNYDIKFLQADCISLPFDNDSFDVCTISFGLRNIENQNSALKEIYRVLKKDGIFMHLDFGKSSNFADKIFDFIVPPLVKIFYKNSIPYDYLLESKKTFKSPDELIKTFENYGFKFERRHDFLFGVISSQIMKK